MTSSGTRGYHGTLWAFNRNDFFSQTCGFNAAMLFNPPPSSVDLNLQSATFGSIGGGVRGLAGRVIQLAAKFYF